MPLRYDDSFGSYEIHDLLLPWVSISQLVCNYGYIKWSMTHPCPGAEPPPIQLFRAQFPGYQLSLRVEQSHIYLFRNEHFTGELLPRDAKRFEVTIAWWEDGLLVGVRADDTEKGTAHRTSFPMVIVPPAVDAWAQRHMLDRVTKYPNEHVFVNRFLDQLRQIDWRVNDSASHSSFWDTSSTDDETIHKPKAEPDLMRALHLALNPHSRLANFMLIQESLSGTGRLDWRAVAPLNDGRLCTICIEAKKAHSQDLEHGITTQLPSYMQSSGACFGVYLVLWFKCAAFSRPNKEKPQLRSRLMELRPLPNAMAVEFLNLGRPAPPSKR